MNNSGVCYISNSREASPISMMQKHSSAKTLLKFLQKIKAEEHVMLNDIIGRKEIKTILAQNIDII
jgi:hypothetical protein